MRITAYVQLRRTIAPTGVGKHIINMVRGLSQAQGSDMRVLTTHEDLDASGRIRGDSPLSDLPVLSHPLSRRWMERSWRFTGRPKADRWCGGADWVYCPAETRVPLRRARTAVTVHCVHWFERDYPL